MVRINVHEMHLPPQPPPDVPAPPPGPEAIRSRAKMQSILILGVFSMIAVLILPLVLRIFRGKLPADRTEATQNLRQVHLTLLDFDNDFGRFPDTMTISSVKKETGTTLSLGSSSSNELFRQLLATGCSTEKIFWASSTISPRKPNDVLGSNALAKGECGFAYVAGLSSSDDPSTPLAMAPVIPAKRCFERRKNYQNKAVILFLDGSVRSFPIDRHGKVELNGTDLFDPRQPFWKGKAPDIKWPE